jgi:hypothetical protein
VTDPAIGFWLDYLRSRGGLVDRQHEQALAVLPPDLQRDLAMPEEVAVTADPEVAREEGAVLLAPGHPALDQAVAMTLEEGDVGHVPLPWPPRSKLPDGRTLAERAREQVAVDHGRIDLEGEPRPICLSVLRLGLLITYVFERPVLECEELFVHADSGQPAAEGLRRRLLDAAPAAPGEMADAPSLTPDLGRALGGAYELVQPRVEARGRSLARQAEGAARDEVAAAQTYYDALLASIARRRAQATPDRQAAYDGQAEATRSERRRRLLEIAESHQSHTELRPFRALLLLVPGMLLPVGVRRGHRSYPLALRWDLLTASFVAPVCPHCGTVARLVAGRERLGCEACFASASKAGSPTRDSAAATADLPAQAQARPGDAPPPGQLSLDLEASSRGGDLSRADEPAASWPAPATSQATRSGTRPRESRPPEKGPPRAKRPRERQSPAKPPEERPPAEDVEGLLLEVERLRRLGDRLGPEFWDRVFDKRPWRRVAGGSPLSVLYDIYGPMGPIHAVGLPPGTLADGYSARGAPVDPRLGAMVTHGALFVAETPYPYFLFWRSGSGKPVVTEVLPGPEAFPERPADGEAGPMLYTPPRPRARLTPIEALLWEVDLPRLGLPFVVRCLALLRRLPDPAWVQRHPEPALAGALITAVARASGCRVRRDEVSGWHGCEPREVTRALRDLEAVSGSWSPRFW